MIVAKLNIINKDLSGIAEKLAQLNYDVVSMNKSTVFLSSDDGDINALKKDIKSSKEASKFSGTIKVVYGKTTKIV